MRLSELKTGEKAIIIRVLGRGAFRKRILEMGFVKGKKVKVILNAPLRDPIKYKIMDYEVSLRRSEAELIEVASSHEILEQKAVDDFHFDVPEIEYVNPEVKASISQKTITVALVGNPNAGKT